MTSRTINRWIYVLFSDQPQSKLRLIRRRAPLHIRYFLVGPQVLIRILVTVQTPRHTEWLLLSHDWHLVDVAMTTGTAHSGTEMHGVIEISVVRQFVNTFPSNWLRCSPAFPNRQKLLTLRQDQVVTIHTGSCWRHIGMRGFFDIVVAVAAIHSQVTRMQLVAECHRLHRPVAYVSIPRREKIPDKRHHHHRD